MVKQNNIFTATIDHSKSLNEMIVVGKYDWVNNRDITAEHFLVSGKRKYKIVFELLHFNKSVSSDEVIAEAKQRGLRLAKIEELLAFGEKYPEEQRKFPIVALGSVWKGWDVVLCVPFLWIAGDERILNLDSFGYHWPKYYHFLAVRRS